MPCVNIIFHNRPDMMKKTNQELMKLFPVDDIKKEK